MTGERGGEAGGAGSGTADSPAAAGPSASAFDQIGGEGAVRTLVDRFYDLMELDPACAELRALHPGSLDGSRDKLFWFLCGWLGGPQHYVERFGHPMLRARHLPFRIGIRERDQWLACMRLAMTEQALEAALAQRLADSFFGTADWMRNRAG
jgi:hemoglobin